MTDKEIIKRDREARKKLKAQAKERGKQRKNAAKSRTAAHFTVGTDKGGNLTITEDKDTKKTGFLQSRCFHSGRQLLFTVGELKVFAGARSDLPDTYSEPTVFLNCSGYKDAENEQIGVPKGFEDLLKYVVPTRTIDMNWADGSTPCVTPEFWLNLPSVLVKQGYKKLVIYCMGSHGRTGTALASLLMIHYKRTAYDAVEVIRERHCKNAVETYSQCDYLKDVELWVYQHGLITELSAKEIEPDYNKRWSRSSAPAPIDNDTKESTVVGQSTKPFTFGNH